MKLNYNTGSYESSINTYIGKYEAGETTLHVHGYRVLFSDLRLYYDCSGVNPVPLSMYAPSGEVLTSSYLVGSMRGIECVPSGSHLPVYTTFRLEEGIEGINLWASFLNFGTLNFNAVEQSTLIREECL